MAALPAHNAPLVSDHHREQWMSLRQHSFYNRVGPRWIMGCAVGRTIMSDDAMMR